MERVLVNPPQNATLYRTSLNQAFRPGPHGQAMRMPAPAAATTPGDFSRIPAHSQSPRETGNRSNLKIGSADDPLEQEADQIAEQVIHMPHPKLAVTSAAAQLHRKCAQCEQQDEGEHKLHRKPVAASYAFAGDAPASVHQVLRSPGRPLESSARNLYGRERRLGNGGARGERLRQACGGNQRRGLGGEPESGGDGIADIS